MSYALQRSASRAMLLASRSAGGGGKPGKRPMLNWKERRTLGLEKSKEKSFKDTLRPTGNFDDIARFFDEKKGDLMFDITDMDDFTPPVITEEKANDKKKVRMDLLFGASKGFGMIEYKKKEKFHFRYRFNKENSTSASA